MALSVRTSGTVSLAVSLLIFSGMQYFKVHLASSERFTILGGFLGACLFVFLLTGVSNVENIIFEDSFQAKLVPEVLLCSVVSLAASAMVHRVCVTTCLAFSIMALYYINKISSSTYQGPTVSVSKPKPKKKRNWIIVVSVHEANFFKWTPLSMLRFPAAHARRPAQWSGVVQSSLRKLPRLRLNCFGKINKCVFRLCLFRLWIPQTLLPFYCDIRITENPGKPIKLS